MIRCPNCTNKIPYWKISILTRFNSIKCSSCEKQLIIANIGICSLIGGIGGGVGALVLMHLFRSHFRLTAISITIIWLISLIFASFRFTRLKVK